MGFRFQKRIKLLPGITLNLSKSGVSTSIGGPGATVNLSKRGTRTTVGIPGTGISYSEKLGNPAQTPAEPDDGSGNWLLWAIAALALGMVHISAHRGRCFKLKSRPRSLKYAVWCCTGC